MESFDLINSSLDGTQLIDASAGTGKTFTIAGIFIRLVLEKQLDVHQILVVTYTRAATAELKDRILKRLREARLAIIMSKGSDPYLDAIAQEYHADVDARNRIDRAIVDFDRAAILTIHGFCQKVLYDHAFRTGIAYDATLVTDSKPYLNQLAQDFWRTCLYDAVPEFIAYLHQKKHILTPQYFADLLTQLPPTDFHLIPDMVKPELTRLNSYRQIVGQLRNEWQASRNTIINALAKAPLKGNIYGSQHTDGKVPSKRHVMITAMAEDMDRFLTYQQIAFPLFSRFEKFTAAKLSRSVRKSHSPPRHRLFDLCDRLTDAADGLEREMALYVRYLKAELVTYAQKKLKELKQQEHIFFFDDLLTTLRNTLVTEQSSGKPELAKILRNQYRAALVDEFQDTDSIQYEIFAHLFLGQQTPFFMIGDPKQSIYSFRGADIFSYLNVSKMVDTKATLAENWRSSSPMINAVNTLFSNADLPFVFPDIAFEKSDPAPIDHQDGFKETPGLHLWTLMGGDSKTITKSDATRRVIEAVVSEVARLAFKPQPIVSASDIAVLVRTNRQAQLTKDAFLKKGLAAVIHSTGNVFLTDEAIEMERLLKGIRETTNERRFRAALVGLFIGVDASFLQEADSNPQAIDKWRHRFQSYHDTWIQSGFAPMLRQLMNEASVRQRLLTLPDGERRLTNVLHLMEILHHASVEQKLNMSALVRWLSDQIHNVRHLSEEHLLRLESDVQAVQILTVHKSKGLEYPVVFCPFAWEGIHLKKGHEVYFHDAASQHRLVLDLGSNHIEQSRTTALKESLAESLRLLYVAVTRAKQRCYLVWGRISSAETSALTYLLFKPPVANENDMFNTFKTYLSAISDEDCREHLKSLVSSSEGTIATTPLPSANDLVSDQRSDDFTELKCRSFTRTIRRDWTISSYSSLASRHPGVELSGADGGSLYPDDRQITTPEPMIETNNMMAFPRGSRAGLFVHDLFEHLDFCNPDPDHRAGLIQHKLYEHGYSLAWQDAVNHMVKQVLTIPLNPKMPHFNLSSLTISQKINEMEFYYPIKPIQPEIDRMLLESGENLPLGEAYASPSNRLTISLKKGFMRGFIDLVFEHQNRFYLIDWKTNYLGSHIDDYSQDALHKVMNEANYWLQSYIYTLALHLYLKNRKPDYQFDTDFGGAYYLFIRGVDTKYGPDFGILECRPSQRVIETMAAGLGMSGES